MSDTIVDMAKVTQMLDALWTITIFKNGLNSYTVTASHENPVIINTARDKFIDGADEPSREFVREMWPKGECEIDTDDFTPEQALTRMAYKVHGECI